MVAPVENRSFLTGVVRSRRRSPEVERWDLLEIEVGSVVPLDDRPSIVHAPPEVPLEIAVDRADLPPGDLVGWSFAGPVRLAGPGRVAAVPTAAGEGAPELRPGG